MTMATSHEGEAPSARGLTDSTAAGRSLALILQYATSSIHGYGDYCGALMVRTSYHGILTIKCTYYYDRRIYQSSDHAVDL